MRRLERCPICGTEPFTEISLNGKNIILKIRCNSSKCGIVKTIEYETKYATFDDMREAINSATQSWNSRIKTT